MSLRGHIHDTFPVGSNTGELLFENGDSVGPCEFCRCATSVKTDVSVNVPGSQITAFRTSEETKHCHSWFVCPNCFGAANELHSVIASEADAAWERDRRGRIATANTPIHITPNEFFDLSEGKGALGLRDGVFRYEPREKETP